MKNWRQIDEKLKANECGMINGTFSVFFRWEEVPGMLEKRIGAVAVIVGEEVWVIGGGDGNGSASTEILELEDNDPINWKWNSGPQLLNARYGNTGCGVFKEGIQN